MFTDVNEIDRVLSNADIIFCMRNGRKELLLYSDMCLITSNRSGLIYCPVREVAKIVFDYDCEGWEVFFKEGMGRFI